MEILELDVIGLVAKILEICDGSMEIISPVVSIEEAVKGKIISSPDQFIRLTVSGKVLNFRFKPQEIEPEEHITDIPKDK